MAVSRLGTLDLVLKVRGDVRDSRADQPGWSPGANPDMGLRHWLGGSALAGLACHGKGGAHVWWHLLSVDNAVVLPDAGIQSGPWADSHQSPTSLVRHISAPLVPDTVQVRALARTNTDTCQGETTPNSAHVNPEPKIPAVV